MAFANFSLATAYATIISMLNTQLTAVGKLFKDQTTGDYTDQIRYNSSLDRLEYWTGSAWAALPMTGTASGTAATLATARTIGGVSFNGSANINLPGVNAAGNQATSGNAATATVLQTARTIGGVSFNGSANIDLPGVNTTGNQNTTGNAATASLAGNSDMVDGYHASAFSLATHNHDSSYAPMTAVVACASIVGDAITSVRFTRVNGATFDVTTYAAASTGGGS